MRIPFPLRRIRRSAADFRTVYRGRRWRDRRCVSGRAPGSGGRPFPCETVSYHRRDALSGPQARPACSGRCRRDGNRLLPAARPACYRENGSCRRQKPFSATRSPSPAGGKAWAIGGFLLEPQSSDSTWPGDARRQSPERALPPEGTYSSHPYLAGSNPSMLSAFFAASRLKEHRDSSGRQYDRRSCLRTASLHDPGRSQGLQNVAGQPGFQPARGSSLEKLLQTLIFSGWSLT